MGRAGRVWVWALLFVSVGVNLGFLWVTPIIPDRPVCFGERTFNPISLLTGYAEISGDLTDDFHDLWARTLDGTRYHAPRRGRVLMRIGEWFDLDNRYHATFKTVKALMEARESVRRSELGTDISLPGFGPHGIVTCQGLRDIAIVGGKWEHGGPWPAVRRENGTGAE